ncbi:MAG: adenosylhomocysteinase, partial [Sulfobacillus sp.]
MAEGDLRIDWAASRMPVLSAIRKDFVRRRPLSGERLAICIHLEAKTAVVALALAEAGASVTVCGSNPLSTQDQVAQALGERGVAVFARRGIDTATYQGFLDQALERNPTLIMDDGGDLVQRALDTKRASGIRGGTEETTTGVVRLRQLVKRRRLPFPMVAVNDGAMKHLFDNRFGTGQSALEGVMRATNISLAGARLVVVGFGDCGVGVAERGRGLGADVAVVEVDPVRANLAHFDGFRVLSMDQAARWGEVFITVTGNRQVIRGRHLDQMQDGAILANAGHFDVEVDKPALFRRSQLVEEVRPNVQAFRLKGGRSLYLLADGRLVNLVAGDGHPIEIMDLSFSVQALSLAYLAATPPPPGLHP